MISQSVKAQKHMDAAPAWLIEAAIKRDREYKAKMRKHRVRSTLGLTPVLEG